MIPVAALLDRCNSLVGLLPLDDAAMVEAVAAAPDVQGLWIGHLSGADLALRDAASSAQCIAQATHMSVADRARIIRNSLSPFAPAPAPTPEVIEAAQAVDAAVQAGEDPAPALARLRQSAPRLADMAERVIGAAADMAEGDRIRQAMTPAEREMGAEAAAGASARMGRGGARPGAGRPPTTGRRDGPAVSFRISPAEDARVGAVLAEGETRSGLAQRLMLEEIERREKG